MTRIFGMLPGHSTVLVTSARSNPSPSLRFDRRVSQLLGGYLNHFAIAPDRDRTPVSYMRFYDLLKSRFEGHFSPFPQGQLENIRRRFSRVSHIAQSKPCMCLASFTAGWPCFR